MSKITIIEGIDGIGKTTAVNRLCKNRGYKKVVTPMQNILVDMQNYENRDIVKNVEHFFVGVHCSTWELILSGFKPESNTVFDRSYLSSLVYGSVPDKQPYYLQDALWELDEKIAEKQKELDLEIFLFKTDNFERVAARNLMREGEPYWSTSESLLKKTQERFIFYSEKSKCNINIIEITQSEGIETQLDRLNFGNTNTLLTEK